MSTTWLVGIKDEWLETVNEVLSGFFGVRRIGSLKNLTRLIALSETPTTSEFICLIRIVPSDDLISIFSSFSSVLKEIRPSQLVVIGELTCDQRKVVENFRGD